MNSIRVLRGIVNNVKCLGDLAPRRQSIILNDVALRDADTDPIHEQRVISLSAAYTDILNSIGEDSMRQ
ncbi:unnamed protein product, partial [Adineta ricciae]